MKKLAPSILSSDLADLAGAVRLCEQGGADLIHVDVMDGHFVPNLSFGIPVIKSIKARTALPLDVHLMVSNPDRLLDEYVEAGASRVAVHWEASVHLDRLLGRIRDLGAAAGVVLNPSTPVEMVIDSLARLDFVLLMSVNPGFGGQAFLPHVLDKARRLQAMIGKAGRTVEIEMDGGIDRDNIALAAAVGVDTFVVGSAIFAAPEPLQRMLELRRLAGSEKL